MGTQLTYEYAKILQIISETNEVITLDTKTTIDSIVCSEAGKLYAMSTKEVDDIVEELQLLGYVTKEWNITASGRISLKNWFSENENSTKEKESTVIINNIEKIEHTENHKPLSTVNLNATAKGISILEK